MLTKGLFKLGIFAAGVAFGAAYWKSDAEAQQHRFDERVSQHVQALRTFVRTALARSGGYGEAVFPAGNELTKAIIAAGAAPAGLTAVNESIVGAHGEQGRVDGDHESFWIVYTGVDYAACVIAAASTDSGWLGIAVNDSPLLATGSERAGPLRAAQNCREASDNRMLWRSH